MIDLGAGDDGFVAAGARSITVTLGSGRVEFVLGYTERPSVDLDKGNLRYELPSSLDWTITDFIPDEDHLRFNFIETYVGAWKGNGNPFADGYTARR